MHGGNKAALKPRAVIIRSSKQGYLWSHKRTDVLQKLKKMSVNMTKRTFFKVHKTLPERKFLRGILTQFEARDLPSKRRMLYYFLLAPCSKSDIVLPG